MEKQQNKQGQQDFQNENEGAQGQNQGQSQGQGGEDISKQDVLEGMGEGIQKDEQQEEE